MDSQDTNIINLLVTAFQTTEILILKKKKHKFRVTINNIILIFWFYASYMNHLPLNFLPFHAGFLL